MLPDPKSRIVDEIAAFDADPETALAESTLRQLIGCDPSTKRIEYVYLKVIAINTLYHARVFDVDLRRMAEHIRGLNLDDKLKSGDPDVIQLIYMCPGARRKYYSFATKFCSWHNQKAYAIYDGNVWEALKAYRAQNGSFTFHNSEFNYYATFFNVINRFRKAYDLEGYSLKQVDKFLWMIGAKILGERKKR